MSGQVARGAVGVRKDTRVIDTLLGKSIPSWMGMDQSTKDQYRRNFLKDRKTGKRWCELAHYFGPGVLVTCGTKIDRLMYVLIMLSQRRANPWNKKRSLQQHC